MDGPQLDKPWRLHPASSRVLPRGPDGAQSPDARPHRSQHLSGGVASAEPSGCNPQDLTEKTDAPGKSLQTCRRPWLVSGGGTCIKVPENLATAGPGCLRPADCDSAQRRPTGGRARERPGLSPGGPQPGPLSPAPKPAALSAAPHTVFLCLKREENHPETWPR